MACHHGRKGLGRRANRSERNQSALHELPGEGCFGNSSRVQQWDATAAVALDHQNIVGFLKSPHRIKILKVIFYLVLNSRLWNDSLSLNPSGHTINYVYINTIYIVNIFLIKRSYYHGFPISPARKNDFTLSSSFVRSAPLITCRSFFPL